MRRALPRKAQECPAEPAAGQTRNRLSPTSARGVSNHQGVTTSARDLGRTWGGLSRRPAKKASLGRRHRPTTCGGTLRAVCGDPGGITDPGEDAWRYRTSRMEEVRVRDPEQPGGPTDVAGYLVEAPNHSQAGLGLLGLLKLRGLGSPGVGSTRQNFPPFPRGDPLPACSPPMDFSARSHNVRHHCGS